MKDLIRLYRDPAVVIDPPATAVEPPIAVAPGALPADLKPGSASTTIDLNTPDPKVVPPPAFVLPDAYKDKPYLKGIDSQDKLFKMLDGAQELIGKKGPAIPKDDAPQAEKDAYYESIGRPKTPGEYALDGADKADPKFLPKVQAALHKAGLSQSQAKSVWADVNVALSEFVTDKNLADAKQNTDFDKLAADTFGVDRDKVLARSKDLLNQFVSPAMKNHVATLPNESLVVLADVLRSIDKKYISPDGAPSKGPDATGMTPADISLKARSLMSEQSKFNPMSPEFNSLQKQIDDLYNSLRRSGR